jgi:hypothetical protein
MLRARIATRAQARIVLALPRRTARTFGGWSERMGLLADPQFVGEGPAETEIAASLGGSEPEYVQVGL